MRKIGLAHLPTALFFSKFSVLLPKQRKHISWKRFGSPGPQKHLARLVVHPKIWREEGVIEAMNDDFITQIDLFNWILQI